MPMFAFMEWCCVSFVLIFVAPPLIKLLGELAKGHQEAKLRKSQEQLQGPVIIDPAILSRVKKEP
jgi:hypothetical protein